MTTKTTTKQAMCPAELMTKKMVHVYRNGRSYWECQSCLGYHTQDQIDSAEKRMS